MVAKAHLKYLVDYIILQKYHCWRVGNMTDSLDILARVRHASAIGRLYLLVRRRT
jgi:hypothetical protein